MPTISLDQAVAGMVVSEDVLDRKGRVLIPQGGELSERTLEALRGWGVESLSVEGGEEVQPLDPVALEEARGALSGRFLKTDLDHPFVSAVLDRAAQQRVLSGDFPATPAQPHGSNT